MKVGRVKARVDRMPKGDCITPVAARARVGIELALMIIFATFLPLALSQT